MITPTELRIGNLILIDKTQVVIESIDSYGINLTCSRDGLDYEGRFKIAYGLPINIFGIKLTEEWMLKFGAEKIFSINYIAGFKISDIIFWQKEDGFFHLPTETKIKYVHRLQNFFYELKNEELTIKETELK